MPENPTSPQPLPSVAEKRPTPKMKAEILEAALLAEDASTVTRAACDAAQIIINGKPFEPEGPVRSDDLADLLNAQFNLVGSTVRFEFDDHSYCEVAHVSRSKTSRQIYIEVGGRAFPNYRKPKGSPSA